MTQAQEFAWFLNILHNNGLLKYVMVIGSWAEYLYAQCGVLDICAPNLRTLDVDFLIKNLRQPSNKINLISAVSDAGCTIDCDSLNGAVKIYTPGLLEIEFLIAQKGAGTDMFLDTNLGIKSLALQHLSLLRDYTIAVNFQDINITLPEPEAYVLHKMIINHKRKSDKQHKDILAIKSLFPYINKERFNEILAAATMKEKSYITKFMNSTEPINPSTPPPSHQ